MGECSDCYESAEMSAIKRLARKRMIQENYGPSTDYLDRLRFDEHVKDIIAEFTILNGRPPKESCFD